MTPEAGDQRAAIRRALSYALVAALCVAALTAIGAILTGDFDETDGRVLATSLGFAVFSATAASGASLRWRAEDGLRALGAVTMALSGAAFLILVAALWLDGEDTAWRWFGALALAALAGSHASLVAGGGRAADGAAIATLARTSIVLALVDAGAGIAAISGAVDEVDGGYAQLMAVLVILLLLSTALPPILRRLQPAAARTASITPPSLAAQVLAAADRIEALDPAASELRRECERLRTLARTYAA